MFRGRERTGKVFPGWNDATGKRLPRERADTYEMHEHGNWLQTQPATKAQSRKESYFSGWSRSLCLRILL